jgi:hypothetical protein
MVSSVLAVELVAAGALLAVAWYLWFLRCNRSRGRAVVGWIQRAFAKHGQIAGMHWENPARFRVQLRLAPAMFQHVWLTVRLFPRHLPLSWLFGRMHRRQETITFQADLDSAPCFDLEVHNHRWCGPKHPRSGKTKLWSMQQAGPFVLTTRNEWQREITTMMNALVASRECDCTSVCIRRTSPHFSVTVPLAILAPEARSQTAIFDVLRELAIGASTARF